MAKQQEKPQEPVKARKEPELDFTVFEIAKEVTKLKADIDSRQRIINIHVPKDTNCAELTEVLRKEYPELRTWIVYFHREGTRVMSSL